MLLPAAVHPESGYRYYDPSQVAEAEVVVAQFDLVAHDGKCRVRPAMIHRSICPPWSAWSPISSRSTTARSRFGWRPPKCGSLPVVDDATGYALTVRDRLRDGALRVEVDDREATLAARVRDAQRDAT
ncbi:MAG: His/Gly/Thr/Pro-type tRNA ligase C-terminal domain-containing protein [Chloroflexota bacterium]|nr:His/Gly/Thr/Pro-type tRNA ligase C-terminal domain-containing protein [Chloroflexota bacterium]